MLAKTTRLVVLYLSVQVTHDQLFSGILLLFPDETTTEFLWVFLCFFKALFGAVWKADVNVLGKKVHFKILIYCTVVVMRLQWFWPEHDCCHMSWFDFLSNATVLIFWYLSTEITSVYPEWCQKHLETLWTEMPCTVDERGQKWKTRLVGAERRGVTQIITVMSNHKYIEVDELEW